MATLSMTCFRNVKFSGCKMLGLHFDACNPIGLSFKFENCILNHSSFFKLKLKGTVFEHCTMHKVDFSDVDLSNVVFKECDLMMALFENTNLKGADFTTALQYALDPEVNVIKGAKFAYPGVLGLLTKYGIDVK